MSSLRRLRLYLILPRKSRLSGDLEAQFATSSAVKHDARIERPQPNHTVIPAKAGTQTR